MTAAWVLDCHYNIVHVLSTPQTTTTGVGVAKCWADLEILAQSEARCQPTHGCKSATSTSTKVLQVFINLLGTQAMPIHQYICQPTSLGGRQTAKHCPDVGQVSNFLTENLPTSGCKSVALISRNVLKVVNDCCMGT